MKLTVSNAFEIIETETFSVAQTMKALGCKRQNVIQLIDRNKLDARKIGQDYRITRESIDEYAESRRKTEAA